MIPIIGTFAQALLGGVTVLTGLSPLSVSSHFLVSILISAGCVALVVRSYDLGDQPTVFLVRPELRLLVWLMVGVAFIVVLLGVIVTGSGPHSGDSDSESRFGFDPRTVAWLHADVVLLFVGLILAMLLAVRLTKGPARLFRLTYPVLCRATCRAGDISCAGRIPGLGNRVIHACRNSNPRRRGNCELRNIRTRKQTGRLQ